MLRTPASGIRRVLPSQTVAGHAVIRYRSSSHHAFQPLRIVHRDVGEHYTFEAGAYREVGGRMATVVPIIYGPTSNVEVHFVECILKDKEPEASADQGRYVMQVLDAICESARKGREVKGL